MALGVLVVMSSVQMLGFSRAADEQVSVVEALAFGFATWGPWMLAAPFIVVLGRHLDFRRGRRLASIAAHAALAVLLAVLSTALIFYSGQALFGEGRPVPWGEIMQQALAGSRSHFSVVLYAAVLVLARAMEARQALGAERSRAARSEALATQAQLAALAARLQPHFLFNALHAVGALIDEDPAKARAMLARLGELLRDALAEGGSGDITLAEEFRLLDRYLAVEAMRFTDRLAVTLTLDPAVAGRPVPRFLLQPLVENALHHGVAPRLEGGHVRVDARAVEGALRIVVTNDGVPLPTTVRERGGLGATRDRLRIRFGDGARLEVAPGQHGGTDVTVTIPPATGA